MTDAKMRYYCERRHGQQAVLTATTVPLSQDHPVQGQIVVLLATA